MPTMFAAHAPGEPLPATRLRIPGAAALFPREGFARLRYGIVALMAAILLVTGAGVVVGTLEERSDRIAESQSDALILARSVENSVIRVLERTGAHLVDARAAIEAEGDVNATPSARLEAGLRALPSDETARRHLVIAGREGHVLAITGASDAHLSSVAGRPLFAQHRDYRAREPLVSAPIRSGFDGRWRLPVSVRLDRRDGSFAGVAVTTLDVEYLASYFESLGLPHDGAISLVTARGEFLARHPALPEAEYSSVGAEARRLLKGVEGSLVTAIPIGGAVRLGSYSRLGQHPVYVVVTYSRERLLDSWRSHALWRGLGGAGVLAITAMFTILLLRQLRLERAAARNLVKFRRAVDLSGDLIYWIDSHGRIMYLNDAAARRLGVDPGCRPPELHIRQLSATYTYERWRDLSDTLLRHGEVSYESEHSSAGGSRYPVQVSATRLQVDREDFAFLIVRDLSEQVRQEREIRELNASLEQRVNARTAELEQANAELESFAHSVSHDLRAPLNHLASYAEALQENDCTHRGECPRLTRKIIERSAYMNNLIDALLQLSHVSRAPLERREVDVSEMAAEIDAEHRKLEPGRNVETCIQPGMRTTADPVLLRTVLENLIGNAWKYSSREPQARIQVFGLCGKEAPTFVVRDNGTGFDPRYAARLFSAFHRLHTQQEFPGTGVGLATARRVVARHGGRIWAESAPGAGAIFSFTLP